MRGSFLVQVKLILSAEWTNSMITARESFEHINPDILSKSELNLRNYELLYWSGSC